MSTAFPGQFSPIVGSFQSITLNNTVAQSLTVPTNAFGIAKFALIQVVGANVNWRDDGTAPTSSVGMLVLGDAEPIGFVGNLSTAQFISTSSSGSTLLVSYYN